MGRMQSFGPHGPRQSEKHRCVCVVLHRWMREQIISLGIHGKVLSDTLWFVLIQPVSRGLSPHWFCYYRLS